MSKWEIKENKGCHILNFKYTRKYPLHFFLRFKCIPTPFRSLPFRDKLTIKFGYKEEVVSTKCFWYTSNH